MKMKLLILFAAQFAFLVSGFISSESETLFSFSQNDFVSANQLEPLMVNLTLIQGADSKGAGIYFYLYLSFSVQFSFFLKSGFFV
jgi:hypothetical protein